MFDAWLNPAVARRWLFATASRRTTHFDIDARVGGSFRFVDRLDGQIIEHRGHYIETVPSRRPAFNLLVEDRSRLITRVVVEIAPSKAGCKLSLTHHNLPAEYADYAEAR